MNEVVNNSFLAGDNSRPEMHLTQFGFTCSACGPTTKSKKQYKTVSFDQFTNAFKNESSEFLDI